MKQISWMVLGWLLLASALLASNAQCADEPLPPEVKALIGMKLPPKVVGKKQALIPDFKEVGGALVDTDEKQGSSLAYSEGVVGNKWPVFIVERIASDRSAEILDAKMLPENLIEWRHDDGNIKFLKGRHTFSEDCHTEEQGTQLIFGLVKPEKGKSDCAHYSGRVKRAWQVDRQSGQITPIPTKGIKCEYGISSCY
jgi:hypothetical protein